MEIVVKNNSILKKILVILLAIIILNNFIMPNYVRAEDDGIDKLIKGFFGLILKLGDAILQIMQYYMMGVSDITNLNEYEVLYSPGIIFSNLVPALRIDFIGQDEQYNEITYKWNNVKNEKQLDNILNAAKAKNSKQESYYNQSFACEILNAIQEKVISEMSSSEIDAIAEIIDAEGVVVSNKNETRDAFRELWNNRFSYLKDFQNYEMNTSSWVYNFKPYFNRIGIDIKSFLAGELTVDDLEGISWDGGSPDGRTGEVNYFNKYAKLPFSYGYNADDRRSDPNEVVLLTSEIKTYSSSESRATIYDDLEYKFIWNDNVYEVTLKHDLGETYKMYVNYYDISNIELESTVVQLENTDYRLKPQISKWYNALRTIALVGLLSVILYIGIRIILASSSAQSKAKYKNMLKDWLVAACILFVLHYVMAFMLQFNQALNEILIGSTIAETLDGNYRDELMSSVRKQIGEQKDASIGLRAGQTLIWLTLVILTAVFTFQYLKRVIYMAFLTMIAPMIALTYPLDKIKDSKAQAFSFWLKEYIFECLIQPVHLLLYSMLLGTALDFAKSNMIYALVALAFLVPAEKLIKNMFGMKSETSVGNFSAAMGGAAVLNMLSKLKSSKPKDGAEGSSGKSEVKSASSRAGTMSGGRGKTHTGGSEPLDTSGANPAIATANSEDLEDSNQTSFGNRLAATGRGLWGVTKRAIEGPKGLRYRGRKLAGLGVGAAGAMLGAAAGISTGDVGNVFKGVTAGYLGGSALGEKASVFGYGLNDRVKNVAEDYSNAWSMGQYNIDPDSYKKAGVSDKSKMIKLSKAGLTADDMKLFSGISADKVLDVKDKYGNASNEYLASMFTIARNAPRTLDDFKAQMIGRNFAGQAINDERIAEDIFRQLPDFYVV